MRRMRLAAVAALMIVLSLLAGPAALGQPTAIGLATARSPALATTPEVTYAHDDVGRLTAVFDSTGAGTKMTYDQSGNITSRQALPAGTLAVAQISPQHAHAGSSVDVHGTGFGTTLSAITVSFNGVAATPTALYRNRLTVTVPPTATTGTVTVKVGTTTTATYTAFTVAAQAVPTVSGLSTALANPGDAVSVSGSGFDPDPSLDVVSVNGTVVRATAATSTSVTFAAPATRSFGHVSVRTPAGTAVSTADVVTPPSPFLTADVGWVGRVKTDGTGTKITLGKTQQVGLALFDVPAGQRARVVVSGATFADAYELHVWSPNETTAARSESVSVSGSTTFDLPGGISAGSYEVEVRPAATDTGSVTLSVLGVADATAAATVDGTAVTATTTTAGQHAVYQFTGVAGQRVFTTLTTVSATGNASAQLVSPAGQVLATNSLLFSSTNSVGYLDSTTLPMNGAYRVEIAPANAGTGSYKVQVASVPPDLATAATVGGPAVPLAFTKAGQNAKVSFTAAAGTRVFTRITVSGSSDSSKCFNASLGDGAGSVYGSACASSSTYIDAISLPNTASYVLSLDPAGAVTGSVSITLLAVPADAVVAAAADGTTRSATTTTGQNAVFTFSGTAGQRVFARPGITGSTTGTSLHTTLYAPDGRSVTDSYNGDPIPTAALPSTGTYKLVVDPYGDETGTVAATIYDVPADVTATAALDGTTATATIASPGQGAVFTFTVPANQMVYITGAATITDTHGTLFSVRDPSGSQLGSKTVYNSVGVTVLEPKVLAAAGAYTVRVTPAVGLTGTITLHVYNSFVTATTTIGGAAVSVTTTKPGQKAVVSFTAAANQVVDVTGSTTTTDSNGTSTWFYLLSPTGTTLASNNTNTQTSFTVFSAKALSTAGTYKIQVEPPGGLSGKITLKVAAHTAAAPAAAVTAKPSPPPTAPSSAVTPTSAAPPRMGEPVWSLQPRQPSHASAVSLTGRILSTDGTPLPGVTVAMDGRTAETGHDGRFALHGLVEGTRVLRLDGRSASGYGKTYGVFDVQVHLKAGENTLFYTPYLPALDTAHEIAIDSPTTHEVVLTNPAIPGLEVHIPAGDAITDADGKPVHRLGITPIPVDRTPIPMPQGVQVPVYYTVQPAGGEITGEGVRIVYPNYLNQKPGTPVNFWHYEKNGEAWETYGHGTVDAAGKQVQPDEGTEVHDFDGAMINVPGLLSAARHGLADAMGLDGDPVDLQTGLFELRRTDLRVDDVMPLELTRAYNSGDTNERPMGIGTNDLYDTFLTSASEYQEADLNFVDGSTVHYVRTTPGNAYATAVFAATATPTEFAGSVMTWNGAGWHLTLRDGRTLIYGENAPLQAIRDPNGNQITVIRQFKNSFGSYIGDVTDVRSPNGYFLHYTYDASDRVTEVDDGAGRSVKYGYDTTTGNGHLSTVTDPDGGITTYGYDAAGRLTTLTDARQKLFMSNTYDANDRVATQQLATGVSYTFAYTLNANGTVMSTTVTDNSGHVRTVTYDANGLLTGDTRAAGTPSQRAIGITSDPVTQLPTSIDDGLDRKITTSYDTTGQVLSSTYAAGTSQASTTTETHNHTPYGLADTVTDPMTHTGTLAYDSAGNVTSVGDPLGNSVAETYNAQGQLATDKTPLKYTTTYGYDNGGQGNLASITDALGHVERVFHDAAGREAVETAPDGTTQRIVYDAAGAALRSIDANGNITAFSYDADGNPTAVTDGRQTALGTAGKATTYLYDDADRIISATDPLGASDRYTYDPRTGQLSTWTDRRGQTTEYQYDDLGRITFTGYGRTGSAAPYTYESTLTYTYDSAGRLHTLADSTPGAGTLTYGYDQLDRLTSESGPSGSIAYDYYADGRLKSLTPSGLTATAYTYDNAGRPKTVTQGGLTVGYTFDSDDQLATETLPGGIVITPTHDADGQVTGATYTKGTTTLGTLSYTYDATGRIISVTGTLAATSLPAPVSTLTYDAANRLTGSGSTTPAYDDAGNLTNDGVSGYTWNARGQLTGVGGPQSATLAYDPAGRLRSSTIGASTTTFRTSGVQPIAQQGSDGTSLTYLAGLGVDDILATTDGTGKVRTLLPDVRGSIIATGDSTGSITATFTYDPFGAATAPSGDTNPVRYTGLFSGPGLPDGLQYNRDRFYSPGQERFISQDPGGLAAGSADLYAYAGGDPVDNTDPTGDYSLVGIKLDYGDFLSRHWRGPLQTSAFLACLGGPLVCGIAEGINTGADYLGDGATYGWSSHRALGNLESDAFWDLVSVGTGYGAGRVFTHHVEKDGFVTQKSGEYVTRYFWPRDHLPRHAAGRHAMDWAPVPSMSGWLVQGINNQGTCSTAFAPDWCSWPGYIG